MVKKIGIWIVLFGLIAGCAGAPVRTALRENLGISPGIVEGNRFTGTRYPFGVSVPSHWRLTTEYPDFLEKLGYHRPLPADEERTELYAYNPVTESNIQIDVTPASPHATFSQETIERLTTVATESLQSELDEHHGEHAVPVAIGPTRPASLKGVPIAAEKHVSYTLGGTRQEQGWIFGFTEPYQIFILYLILDREGSDDRQDIRRIVESFEWRKKD